jgi:hypothetical protein
MLSANKKFIPTVVTWDNNVWYRIDNAAIFFLDFLMDTLRGMRMLSMAEGRSLATILRKGYPKLFAASLGINFILSTVPFE